MSTADMRVPVTTEQTQTKLVVRVCVPVILPIGSTDCYVRHRKHWQCQCCCGWVG